MIITIGNVQKTTNPGDTVDITIAYGARSETFRKVVLSTTDPSVQNKDPSVLNNRINGISTLVTVAPTTPPNYPASFTATAASGQVLTTTLQAGTVGVFNATDFTPVFAADSFLDKVPVFNLMIIPGIVNNSVLSEALAFCERKLAFYIMDPPPDDQADNVPGKNWIGDFIQTGDHEGNVAPKSPNGALYFPFLKSLDPLSGANIQNPPSG